MSPRLPGRPNFALDKYAGYRQTGEDKTAAASESMTAERGQLLQQSAHVAHA